MDQKTKGILDALVDDGVIDAYFVTDDGDDNPTEGGEYVGKHRAGVATWWPFSDQPTQRLPAVVTA